MPKRMTPTLNVVPVLHMLAGSLLLACCSAGMAQATAQPGETPGCGSQPANALGAMAQTHSAQEFQPIAQLVSDASRAPASLEFWPHGGFLCYHNHKFDFRDATIIEVYKDEGKGKRKLVTEGDEGKKTYGHDKCYDNFHLVSPAVGTIYCDFNGYRLNINLESAHKKSGEPDFIYFRAYLNDNWGNGFDLNCMAKKRAWKGK